MQPLLKDWAFARAAVVDLQEYLLSKTLYWKLSPQPGDGAAGQPLSLTPGNLLLSLMKLNAYPWQGEQKAKLSEMQQQLGHVRRQWRSAWLRKCDQELAARVKLWQEYLLEASNEGGCLVDYPFQARWRTIIELLLVMAWKARLFWRTNSLPWMSASAAWQKMDLLCGKRRYPWVFHRKNTGSCIFLKVSNRKASDVTVFYEEGR